MGPRKVRLLVDIIRGMKVAEARIQLAFSKKNAARPLLKLLESAVANAKHNHEMIEDGLIIKEAFVDGGPVLKRWMPRAMGRATPIRKRTSHVTLVLEGEINKKAEKVKKDKNKDKSKKEKKSAEGKSGKESVSDNKEAKKIRPDAEQQTKRDDTAKRRSEKKAKKGKKDGKKKIDKKEDK